uniref:T-box domain-containing protein n=1 Tax=Rhabditophanes sp. KR3021 TaxID=114890 RepID=A0AC35TM48_9BILA
MFPQQFQYGQSFNPVNGFMPYNPAFFQPNPFTNQANLVESSDYTPNGLQNIVSGVEENASKYSNDTVLSSGYNSIPSQTTSPNNSIDSYEVKRDELIFPVEQNPFEPFRFNNASSGISVKLVKEDLWKRFHDNTCEMIVTRAGRKVFPAPEYIIEGLEEEGEYFIHMYIERVGTDKYKYTEGKWQVAGRGEPVVGERKPIFHRNGSVQKGSEISREIFSFDNIKITNNPNAYEHVLLKSMHKYQVKLLIFKNELDGKLVPLYLHEEDHMQFMAVTAYQNAKVTSLKIGNNKYAKGSRGGSDRKAKTKEVNCSDKETHQLPMIQPFQQNAMLMNGWPNPFYLNQQMMMQNPYNWHY